METNPGTRADTSHSAHFIPQSLVHVGPDLRLDADSNVDADRNGILFDFLPATIRGPTAG